jgi:hypothetical protein
MAELRKGYRNQKKHSVLIRILACCAAMLVPTIARAQPVADDGFKGGGAALCIASGELLAAQLGASPQIATDVLAWRQVLHVIDATPERRQAAVDGARSSLADASARSGTGVVAARGIWDASCADRDVQIRYIAVHGSEQRARMNLAEEPGAELSSEAARRITQSASCQVAAELFTQRSPSSRLRIALEGATPSAPDAATLNAIAARSAAELEVQPGSPTGKSLVVDYLRYLYATASGGEAPQAFVNRASRTLRDLCAPEPSNG